MMLIASIAWSEIIRVPDDYPTIQQGIDAAVDGDTVLVADGTYTGDGNRDIDFNGKKITLKSENGAENCIIDCQSSEEDPHRGFYFHNGEDSISVVDGFTIKNGGKWTFEGGGIYCSGSSPTITNNIIINSLHCGHGGAIICQVNSSPTIANNRISGNSAAFGGGISCLQSSPTIIGNIITDNSGTGGGIYLTSSSGTITNNIIANNSGSNGAGIHCSVSSSAIITNNTIVNNSADYYGGGIYYFKDSSSTVLNTILWGNSPQEIYFSGENDPNTITISYSDIQGGQSGIVTNNNGTVNWLDGNIDANPLFGNPYSGLDYDLKPGSPCINAGTSSGAPSTDIVGRPRPSGSGVDIGAYEQNDEGTLAVTLSTFTASASSRSVTLKWRTETEVNNLGFSIYRSEEKDLNYTKISFFSGAGNSAMPIDYQFTDKDVEAGKTYFYYIEDVDIAGLKSKSKIIKVVVPPTKPVLPIPKEFRLLQNYPNPFNPETWLPYELAADATVTIRIYDVNGQLVRQFDLGKKKAGRYVDKRKAAYWDGKDQTGKAVSSGLYFYTLKAGDFQATQRMVIVK